jgi:KDO2-lipid IV(A) lauroyltransferase
MTLALPFRLGNLVVRVLPPAVRYPLAALLGRCAFYAMPRRRQIAMANYGQVLGLPPDHPRTKRTARHAFGNYAKLVADFILMDSLSPEAIRALVRAEGVEHLDRALAQGKGAIAVTAHVSNWDILAAAAAVRGYVVNAVTEELPGNGLNQVVIRARERIGMHVIPLASSGAVRAILRALARNEVVALASDLYRGEHGVPVTFFGRPLAFPPGPAAIALKTGAPLVPVWVRREPDNRYVAEVEAPLEVSRDGDHARDIQLTTERIARFFERIIRRAPDQWFVFLPMWRDGRAPSAQPPLEPVLDTAP